MVTQRRNASSWQFCWISLPSWMRLSSGSTSNQACMKYSPRTFRTSLIETCTAAEAAKFRGRLTWAACAMFGKCGRAGQAALIQCQYSDDSAELGSDLRVALVLFKALLQAVRPLSIPPGVNTPSWEPKHMTQKGLGYIVGLPDDPPVRGGAASVSETVPTSFRERKTQIMPLETLAILQCFLTTVRHHVCNRDIILFCDNQAVCTGIASARTEPDSVRMTHIGDLSLALGGIGLQNLGRVGT